MPILWTSKSAKVLITQKDIRTAKMRIGSALTFVPDPWRTIADLVLKSETDIVVTIEPVSDATAAPVTPDRSPARKE